jgi:ATP-dependent RNA helicase RhlE
MDSFKELGLTNALQNAIDDLGFDTPTPIQKESFPVILSGKNIVGIAQTGTGKTFAYMLPILQNMSFSKQVNPRILVIVPTRELVIQVVENIEELTKYMTLRIHGVYGGVNINTQKKDLQAGSDIIVATPGRLYDLTLSRALSLKSVNKLVIDEVDVMLDLGFRFQLTNIFELLQEKRQNIMFSATMTNDIEELIKDFFIAPVKVSIAVSGTPLDNISQVAYKVENYHTKANLLRHLIQDKETFSKTLVFVASKKSADRLYDILEEEFAEEMGVIHSNKSQNYRIRSIRQFDDGKNRILLTTDVMARGLDLDKISHVINFDTPDFPENYMHRIGRTGRAENEGNSVLFYTEKEELDKENIEYLMAYEIPILELPEEVEISKQLTPEERPKISMISSNHKTNVYKPGAAFHEKKEKNKKENQGGSYRRELAKKYKKPKTRGGKKK